MNEMTPADLELAEIEATTSPEAMGDLWAEVLAGLANVEDDRLADLALKAQALCAEERDPDLREYVEGRIDEIVYGRMREARLPGPDAHALTGEVEGPQ